MLYLKVAGVFIGAWAAAFLLAWLDGVDSFLLSVAYGGFIPMGAVLAVTILGGFDDQSR